MSGEANRAGGTGAALIVETNNRFCKITKHNKVALVSLRKMDADLGLSWRINGIKILE